MTNSINHKPGPWIALPPAEWAGADDQWKVPGVALCGNGELSEANARLIAAAPDLLNMLQQARTMLKAYGSDYDACHVALMDDIDAAIAKATSTTSELGRDR